ncbi:hypothetical protein SDC9_131835 [bioreactor metagenome]|uniref:Uncharacterized protein n=1 Tax=bioreactor metagenome TaxID=1076179 RepID=A0A645D6C7_9ZZZZ
MIFFTKIYFVTPLLSMSIEKSENPTSIEKAYSMINDAMKLVISELNIAA